VERRRQASDKSPALTDMTMDLLARNTANGGLRAERRICRRGKRGKLGAWAQSRIRDRWRAPTRKLHSKSVPGLLSHAAGLVGFRHDTEEIAARVFKDDKVGAGTISPGILLCTNAQQTPDFGLLIWRVQVKMDPTAASGAMIACLK
jgi:hypothetical protein